MSALPPADARRLRSSLALLASDNEGERMAALNAASRLLDKNRLTFADLAPHDGKAERRALYPDRAGPPAPARLLRNHQRESWLLLVSGYPWSEWERGFLGDLRQRTGPISERQTAKLKELRRTANEWREAQL